MFNFHIINVCTELGGENRGGGRSTGTVSEESSILSLWHPILKMGSSSIRFYSSVSVESDF